MRRCTGAKKKEDDSFGISAAICRRIYPLWSGHGGPRPPWRIYALYLLICLTAVTGLGTLCLPFQGERDLLHLVRPLFSPTPLPAPVSSGTARTMLVNARRAAPFVFCPFLTALFVSSATSALEKNFEERAPILFPSASTMQAARLN